MTEIHRREFLAGAGVTLGAAYGFADPPAPPKRTGLVYAPIFKEHDTGRGHPERRERCDAVMGAIAKADIEDRLLRLEPRAAEEAELALCHTAGYIRTAKADVAAGGDRLSTGDTAISAKSFDVALAAAGGVLAAVDAVAAGKVRNAFCVVRPPGHHAGPDRGMGFCLFNNVAIAARYAQKKHKLHRVLIADWDVHHGNGTQDIFYEDGSVFFFSTHQSPWYPGTGKADETGKGPGRGTTMNRPFAAGAGRKEIRGAFADELVPAMKEFKPELVLLSAGFDSRLGDPLGKFRLTDEDFADLTKLMMKLADNYAGGRLVSVLEGGYSLEGLAAGATAHLKALTG